MNQLTPYAAFFMRLAVGAVLLEHGRVKLFQMGLGGVAGYLHSVGIPFATVGALILIVVETVGAICVLLGIFTRFWAICMAVEMLIAILAVRLPHGANFELEGLLFAGAITLVALGDGPLSLAIGLKRGR